MLHKINIFCIYYVPKISYGLQKLQANAEYNVFVNKIVYCKPWNLGRKDILSPQPWQDNQISLRSLFSCSFCALSCDHQPVKI